jgi:iron(III) transport system substrate-binding protein
MDEMLRFLDEPITRREVLKKGATVGAGALLGAGFLGSALARGATPPAIPKATDPAWLKIVKAANEEGQVTYYGVNPDMTEALQTYFHRDYPHITLNIYTSSPAGIQAKLLTEYQAGTKSCDVVQSRNLVLPSYQAVGAVKPALIPNDARLPTAILDKKGYFHPMYIAANCMSHNTNVLKTVPFDLYELADPKYKGLLGIDDVANNGPGWFIVASRRALWGTVKFNQWMAGLKANGIRTFSTASASYTAVVQGTIGISTDSYNDVLGQTSGTPVAASWYEDVIPTYLGVTQVTNAPHPNAALVYMNWMIGPEGQRQFSHSKRFPTVPPAGALTFLKALPNGTTLMPNYKMLPYYQNATAVTGIFCKYLQC